MTIRTRLSLWFAAVLFVSLVSMSGFAYYDFVVEPRQRPTEPLTKELPDDEGWSDVVTLALWCFAPAGLLGLGGGWWLTRTALAPVAALTVAASRINERHMGEPLPRTGNGDEVDRLTEVFNAMTVRLGDAFQRTRLFTLHASHELKTPLTVIHAELETALGDPTVSVEHRERVVSQLDEVQRLTHIVDGLALLTRADAGQMQLEREPVRLDELVRDAADDARSLSYATRVRVEIGRIDELIVLGDRHRLRQLLLILVDNAVKYNVDGGDVTIELCANGADAALSISNTSAGISTQDLPRIFDPFFRGDASHSHAIDGCGLGLSIGRWIAEAHGGQLDIATTPEPRVVATLTISCDRSLPFRDPPS